MPRRARSVSRDSRDWMTRANEQIELAERMPHGPSRDEALRKAEQFRSAAEMMGFLSAASPAAAK